MADYTVLQLLSLVAVCMRNIHCDLIAWCLCAECVRVAVNMLIASYRACMYAKLGSRRLFPPVPCDGLNNIFQTASSAFRAISFPSWSVKSHVTKSIIAITCARSFRAQQSSLLLVRFICKIGVSAIVPCSWSTVGLMPSQCKTHQSQYCRINRKNTNRHHFSVGSLIARIGLNKSVGLWIH